GRCCLTNTEGRSGGGATLGFTHGRFAFLLGALGRITGPALFTLLALGRRSAAGFLAKSHTWRTRHPGHTRHSAPAPVHLLHHCLRRFKTLNELVDLGHRCSGTAGNARAPRAV